MKTSTNQLWEALTVIAIMATLAAFLIPALKDAKKKTLNTIHPGNMVYIDGMDCTGKVNTVGQNYEQGIKLVNLIIKNTNGTVTTLNGINIKLLKKIPSDKSTQ